MLMNGLIPFAAPPKANSDGYPAEARSIVRTARIWPCSLKRARKSCAASRIAAGRSPRGQVPCASSNSWNGRIPTVSGLSMAAMSEAYVDLTCVVHVHSTHSDGTGTVAQIARAAQRAGVDVVLLTDHD